MDLTDTIVPKSDQLEQWRPVVGYEGSYEVSDLGRVRSLDRLSAQGRPCKGIVLSQMDSHGGYRQVNLHRKAA